MTMRRAEVDRIYPIVAAVLPAMLGLGLIELYVERNVGIGVVVAAMAGLAALMIVITALTEVEREPVGRHARIGN
ncbi:MAG TPA: hypothetical protein VLH12_09860 [Usitatibacter sp.]|nr:hypothetical protein [Usitatibacter sp.]